MPPRVTSLFIPATADIRTTIDTIDRGDAKIAVMIDAEGRLLGTVTDGDVRRGLLTGLTLDDPADLIVNRTPQVVSDQEPRAIAHLIMRTRRLRHVPVIDADRRVVDIVLFTELLREAPLNTEIVIMAGGEGRRLRPYTESLPKPMLPVGGRPILETILEQFIVQGLRRIHITVNYRADDIIAHFGDGSRLGAEIRYVRETKPLGTAGALSLLSPPPSGPFILVNGDVLTTLRYRDLLSRHEAARAAITVCMKAYQHQVPFGVLEIEQDRITGIAEKPLLSLPVSAGVYVLSAAVLPLLSPGGRMDMPDLIRAALAQGFKVVPFAMEDYWVDVGRLEDLERANKEYSEIFDISHSESMK